MYMQVVRCSPGSESTTRSSRVSSSAGGQSSSAYARNAARSCPITAAACRPRPITSPIAIPTRPPGSAITSYRSPPASVPAVPGRYSIAISTPCSAGGFSGRSERCRVSADSCSTL